MKNGMKKVLIVDTDPNVLMYLREKLDATNLMIRTACGGEEAKRFFDLEKFDLLITSLEMPHPHGIDLMVELTDRGWKVPVIFLSKLFRENADVHQRLESFGPYMLLDKPIVINRLREAVEHFLKTRLRLTEKRVVNRVPRRLDAVLVYPGSGGEQVREAAKTVDISVDGVCIERHVCQNCTGYEKGGVHPDCLFRPFSFQSEEGGPIEMILRMSGEDVIVLKGKVVHTIIVEGTPREFLGIKFQGVTADQRTRLLKLLS